MTWQQLPMTIALVLPLVTFAAAQSADALNITVTLNSNNTTNFQMTTGANETVPYFRSNNREVIVHSQDQD